MKKAPIDRLDRLQRAGLLRLGSGKLVKRIVSRPAPRADRREASAVAMLLEERDSGQ